VVDLVYLSPIALVALALRHARPSAGKTAKPIAAVPLCSTHLARSASG